MNNGCLELANITGLSIDELSELEFIQHTNIGMDGSDSEQLYFFSKDSDPGILSKIDGLDRFCCLRVKGRC